MRGRRHLSIRRLPDRDVACCWLACPTSHPDDPCECSTPPTCISTATATATPPEQAAHRERGRRVFRRIVDRALTDQVDLVLIAGRPLRSQPRARRDRRVRPGRARSASPAGRHPARQPRLPAHERHLRPARLHGRRAPRPRDPPARRRDHRASRSSTRSCGAAPWKSTSPRSSPSRTSPDATTAAGASPWATASSTRSGNGPTGRRRSSPTRFATPAGTTSPSVTTTSRTDVSQGRVAAYYAGAPMVEGETAVARARSCASTSRRRTASASRRDRSKSAPPDIATGQRGWKRQPLGGFRALGTSPVTTGVPAGDRPGWMAARRRTAPGCRGGVG